MAFSESACGFFSDLSAREDLRNAAWDLIEARSLRSRRVFDRRARKRRKQRWITAAASSLRDR